MKWTGDLVLAEVLQGFRDAADHRAARELLYSDRDFDPFVEHLGLQRMGASLSRQVHKPQPRG